MREPEERGMSGVTMKLPLRPATEAEAEDWGGIAYDGDEPVLRWARIADDGGTVVAYTVSVQDEWDGDAAQKRRDAIVRAVNSHDELVGLLREVTDKFAEELAVRKPKCATFEAEQQRFARDVDVVNRALAALSKAGGTDA